MGVWVDPAYSYTSWQTAAAFATASSTGPNSSSTCLVMFPTLARSLTLFSGYASASSTVSSAGSGS